VPKKEPKEETNDYARRVAQLKQVRRGIDNCYPLLERGPRERTALADFPVIYRGLMKPTSTMYREKVLVAGTNTHKL
jgi:hypothetical protein